MELLQQAKSVMCLERLALALVLALALRFFFLLLAEWVGRYSRRLRVVSHVARCLTLLDSQPLSFLKPYRNQVLALKTLLKMPLK